MLRHFPNLSMHLKWEYYKAINAAFSKMFNFATVIGISKLIGYEVRNIGSIAFGVEQKIPVETTMSKLIIKEAE